METDHIVIFELIVVSYFLLEYNSIFNSSQFWMYQLVHIGSQFTYSIHFDIVARVISLKFAMVNGSDIYALSI